MPKMAPRRGCGCARSTLTWCAASAPDTWSTPPPSPSAFIPVSLIGRSRVAVVYNNIRLPVLVQYVALVSIKVLQYKPRLGSWNATWQLHVTLQYLG